MTKRYQKAPEPTIQREREGFPTDRPVAVYYRQSSPQQINNESTKIQQEDFPADMKKLGWADDQVILIDLDAGVSARKNGIYDRPGSKKLMELIKNGKIGAVAVVREDRLSRRDSLVDVELFMDACAAQDVIVLVGDNQHGIKMIYRFTGPQSSMNRRIFRMMAENAAEFITTHVQYMGRARHNKTLRGEWAGATVAPGYMINPDDRYVKCKPMADVVVKYFRLYVERFHLDVNATYRHICQHGPYYPDNIELDDGYRLPVRKEKVFKTSDGKRCPQINALRYMFTNAAYLGHWVVGGTIVKRNNHEAIVPEQLFFAAFNSLSPVDFDGNPNPDYRPPKVGRHRKGKDKPEDHPRPLCDGLVRWLDDDGAERNVHLSWARGGYSYKAVSPDFEHKVIWQKRADFMDVEVIEIMRARLLRSVDAYMVPSLRGDMQTLIANWREAEAQRRENRQDGDELVWVNATVQAAHLMYPNIEAQRKQIHEELAAAQREKKIRLNKIGQLGDDVPELVEQEKRYYQAAHAQEGQAKTKLARLDDELKRREGLQALSANLREKLEQFDDLSLEDKRDLVLTTIDRIVAMPGTGGELRITIYWHDSEQTPVVLAHYGNGWTANQTRQLLDLVEQGATPEELASAFWYRTGNALAVHYYRMTGKRLARRVAEINRNLVDDCSRTVAHKNASDVKPFDLLALWLAQPEQVAA